MADSKEEKRETIIKAAREVIAKYGFKKVTLEDIAEKANMAKTSVYYYFNSKEEILKAVVRQDLNRLLNQMRDVAESASTPEEKIIDFIKTRYRFLKELKSTAGASLNLSEMTRDMEPVIRPERDRFFGAEMELLKHIIQEGISKGHFSVDDPDLFALIAISGLRGVDDTFVTYGQDERITEGIEKMAKLFIYGVKKR